MPACKYANVAGKGKWLEESALSVVEGALKSVERSRNAAQ